MFLSFLFLCVLTKIVEERAFSLFVFVKTKIISNLNAEQSKMGCLIERIKFLVVLECAYTLLVIAAMSPISPPRITNNPPSPPPMIPTTMSIIAQTMVVTLFAPMIAMTPQIIVTIPK